MYAVDTDDEGTPIKLNCKVAFHYDIKEHVQLLGILKSNRTLICYLKNDSDLVRTSHYSWFKKED
jgi:hypothetical protein